MSQDSAAIPASGRRKPFRRLLTVVRIGLCLGAIAFLIWSVRWHDYVRLEGPEGPRVRLLEQHADEFTVLRDGQTVTVPAADVHFLDVKGGRVADIELGIPTVLRRTDPTQALLAVLAFLPVPFISAVRLIWMLRMQKVELPLWNSIKLTFAGNFFNFALPGTTGGDLIKAYYITHYTHHKTEAVTSVFLDRVVGLLSLVIMAGGMIVFTQDPSQFLKLGITLALIIGGLALFGVVVFSGRIRRALRLRDLVQRLPMHEQLLRIGAATLALRQHKMLLLASILITFGLQGIAMASAVLMAWAMGLQGTFAFIFICVAIGFLVAAVPIAPPQGIGVMESVYVMLLAYDTRNSASQAVALAVAVRLIQLIWALPGVLVPLFGAHMPSRRELAEMEETADEVAPGELAPAFSDASASGRSEASKSGGRPDYGSAHS